MKARNTHPPIATCKDAGVKTFLPTAKVGEVIHEIVTLLDEHGDDVTSVLPVVVVGDDGKSRPVIAFDVWEDWEGGNLTGRAFVLVTGSHDDPHPMWMDGYFRGLVYHAREDGRDPA